MNGERGDPFFMLSRRGYQIKKTCHGSNQVKEIYSVLGRAR